MVLLLIFSVLSWAIIFSKWAVFRSAQVGQSRLSAGLSQSAGTRSRGGGERTVPEIAAGRRSLISAIARSPAPDEIARRVTNPLALERSLQLGMSEEITRLERNMSLLATTATVSPFIGLFGTVWGIIDAFQQLATAGAASLRAVAPGISEALITTAMGLAAAIPAAIFYNLFGNTIKEFGARMEDFMLEFLNLTERSME